MEKKKTIIDSCVFIAFLSENDRLHEKGQKLYEQFTGEDIVLYDYVYMEVLNVLKRKNLIEICRNFLKFLNRLNIEIKISTKEEIALAGSFFFNIKKLSFADSMILACGKLLNSEILTFDRDLEKAWNNLKN